MKIESAELREFATRYTAAWCSQTPGSVAAFFSPGGSLTINGGTPAVGRGAIAEVAQSFMSAFPDLCGIMEDVAVQEDRARYHWTLIARTPGRAAAGARFVPAAVEG